MFRLPCSVRFVLQETQVFLLLARFQATLQKHCVRSGKFFSAYIPGISGIPNKEEKKSKKVILKACSYGDSNIILRNVLLLLKNANPDNITQIEDWISRNGGAAYDFSGTQ